MGQHHGPADTALASDPQSLASAEGMWRHFTTLAKVSTIAVIIVLAGMALFLL